MPKKKLLIALMNLALFLPGLARAESTIIWAGADFAASSYYSYIGGFTALSGQDIFTENGWLLRLGAAYGGYEYDTPAVPGGNLSVDMIGGDAMVGYSHVFNSGRLSLYLGGNVEDHETSATDPGNSIKGFYAGAKALVELSYNPLEKIKLNATGSYSTANDSYWTRASAGYDFGPFTIGPDITHMGNKEFEQTRKGFVLSDIKLDFVTLQVYTGYADNKSKGEDSIYGGLGLSTSF